MRINNKYLRNHAYRNKHWKRIRAKEHPFETLTPYYLGNGGYWSGDWTFEKQVKRHFEWITEQAWAIENGTHRGMFHATSGFRRILNKQRKARERAALNKIRNGDYDAELPIFKKDADWLYF